MLDLWRAASQEAGAAFEELKGRVNYTTPGTVDDIELLLSLCHVSQMVAPSEAVETFINRTEAMVVERCRFVTKDLQLDVHSAFLRKLGRRSVRKPRVKLFTTNYDLCFEAAASRTRFVLIDGFSHSQPQEFDGGHFELDLVHRELDREMASYVPNVLQLYKLHGSVDWEVRNNQIVKAERPARPLIMYPRITKFELSYNQPYLEIMSRFQTSLRQNNTGVLVIGFGFNDVHIAQPIMAAVASNINLKLMIVGPELETSNKTEIKRAQQLINEGDWRLTLAATKFEDFVSLIPDPYAETEEEQHARRIAPRKP
jgi:hypothetical protein